MYVHQVNLPVYHYTDVEQSHLENKTVGAERERAKKIVYSVMYGVGMQTKTSLLVFVTVL